ncbi:MAG: Zn-binding domain-containing protein, partial [Mesotoga sp.]|uniref:Zn-binding domain-containing protein n=1 Tax=Mesotoga sp. TaxID=2053577 RepID=UPI00356635FF
YPEITFGSFTGETKEIKNADGYERRHGRKPCANEVYLREDMRNAPPHILITNYAMLEHILIKPENAVEIFRQENADLWKYIVLDEAHTYGGAKGCEVSMLLGRVKATLQNDKIRFILTSATLGNGPESNRDVAVFANKLTGSREIDESDIIRAQIEDVVKPSNLRDVPAQYYKDILEGGFNSESIRVGMDSEVKDDFIVLGDVILSDNRLWKIRDSLKGGVKTIDAVSQETSISVNEIVDFINVASKSKDRNGRKLFDARYHTFIRSMDGIYVSLAPSSKIFFYPLETYRDERFSHDFVCYPLSVCYNCNAIFLPGREVGNKLVQITGDSVKDEFGDVNDSLYMLCEENEVDDLKREEFFNLCSKCGTLSPLFGSNSCECGREYLSIVRKVVEDGKTKLCSCPRCSQVNNKFGIVRDFYLGSEAASSVLGSAIFNAIPTPEKESGKVKQLLMFSDSRKSASYAAVNLDKTHENLLLHRAIYEVFTNKRDKFSKGMHFEEYVDRITSILDDIDFGGPESDSYDRRKSANFALVKEAISCKSNKSFEHNGLFRFRIDKEGTFGNLTEEETKALYNVMAREVRSKGAVWSDLLSYNDLKEIFLGSGPILKDTSDRVSPYESVLKTKRFSEYLKKVVGEEDELRLIDEFFRTLRPDKKGYRLDLSSLLIEEAGGYYICSDCGKRSPFSVKSICPYCLGTLEWIDSDFDTLDDHYLRQYREMPLVPFNVREHTAQLSKDQLSKYQNGFVNQDINALSCSTTFEMGVNIGSLSTVFLRNVPPAPSNYIQRAGRAGRSVSSSAYVLTFCKNTSHDSHYFTVPEAMISGEVKTPIVNVDNPKIAIRHIFASALSFFWKEKGAAPWHVKDFLQYEYLDEFENYLRNEPQDLKEYLNTFLSEKVRNYSGDDVKIDVDNFGWVDTLFGDEGRMRLVTDERRGDLSSLYMQEEEAATKRDSTSMGRISRTIKTLNEEDTISFLSRGNIIPKYGFPVDTVYLEHVSPFKDSKLDLQRDLSVAITEYAPGCQVVAGGNMITSEYVKVVKGREWDRFAFATCPECNTVSMERIIDKDNSPETIECRTCGVEEVPVNNNTFIVPKFGFQYRKMDKATINKPRRSRGKRFEYKGSDEGSPRDISLGDLKGKIVHNEGDELIALSYDRYYICEECGFGSSIRKKEHNLPREGDFKCKGRQRMHHLGHVFRTDVTILRFEGQEGMSKSNHLSVLYALIEGLCTLLDIERSEVSGCLRSNIGNTFDYVLFDNTPGGAGYVKELTEQNLPDLIDKTIELLEACECGGEEGDASCYGCLRNYSNQQHHEELKRGDALAYLRKLSKLKDGGLNS